MFYSPTKRLAQRVAMYACNVTTSMPYHTDQSPLACPRLHVCCCCCCSLRRSDRIFLEYLRDFPPSELLNVVVVLVLVVDELITVADDAAILVDDVVVLLFVVATIGNVLIDIFRLHFI